jgi:alkylation response protein AidB-like acyl-CoA dehydrogenase
VGAARAAFEGAATYAASRTQFGRAVAGFQLTQQKLGEMALAITNGTLLAHHVGRLKDQGRAQVEHVSLAKLNNVRAALEVCRSARTVLGANGISLEYPVIRHMNNLESVLTYEGTVEMHRSSSASTSPASRPSGDRHRAPGLTARPIHALTPSAAFRLERYRRGHLATGGTDPRTPRR